MKYKWVKPKEQIKEVIKAKYDPIKEWHQDPVGYFLIRVNRKKKMIEVGFVTNNHIITKMIYGTHAIEIYQTIIRKKLLSRLEHAAYLSKELYKAELALKYDKSYIQEVYLRLGEAKVKLNKES